MAIDRAGNGLGQGSPVNIPDADADGLLYGRQDNDWVEVNAENTTFEPAGTVEATTVQDAIEEVSEDVEALVVDLAALQADVDAGSDAGVGTYLISGATIAWIEDYDYSVGAATYYISGVEVSSAAQTVSLDAAHATLDRIDVLVLDADGVLSAIAGTAAADPAEPSIDPALYLRLGIVYVNDNTTEPDLTVTDIYLENAEWTATASAGTIVVDSTSNPRTDTYVVEATAAAAGAYVTFVKPAAGTTDLATQHSLRLHVRVKTAFPANKALRFGWYSGTALRGSQVTVSNGLYGFNSATTGSYQQIVIPISAFNVPSGNLVTTLRMTVVGSGISVGFYVDDITLVSGATTIPSLTASRVLVSSVSGDVAASAVTTTQLTDTVAHVADSSAAHAASAIEFTPTGSIAATDVQAAIVEVLGEATSDWGDIGGTLTDQTDLVTALGLKLDDSQASAFGLTLLDDANAATARETIGVRFTVDDSAPSSPVNGERWLDTTSGIEYTWVQDDDSTQWVELGSGGTSGPTAAVGFSAYRSDTDQVTGTVLLFNAEQFDTNSAYDTTTGVFTAPIAGMYSFDATGEFENNTGGLLGAQIRLTASIGGDFGGSSFQYADGTPFTAGCSGNIQLAAGETVHVYLNTSLSGTFIMTPGTVGRFSGALVGTL